jgi:hypothetical protein
LLADLHAGDALAALDPASHFFLSLVDKSLLPLPILGKAVGGDDHGVRDMTLCTAQYRIFGILDVRLAKETFRQINVLIGLFLTVTDLVSGSRRAPHFLCVGPTGTTCD